MRPALRPALVALAFAGCGPVGFSQLGEFQVRFENVADRFTALSIAYDFQRVGCKTMGEDFTATANVGPAATIKGGPENHLFSGSSCSFPAMVFDRPPQVSDAIALVANAGGEALAIQAESVGFALSGVPLVTPGEVIHVGQRIQIQLGAGWERVSWPAFGGVSAEGTGGPTTIDLAPPSASGVLDVQLPSSLPAGPQHVLVNLTVTPTFTQCEGPGGGCNPAALTAKLDVPFQVQP